MARISSSTEARILNAVLTHQALRHSAVLSQPNVPIPEHFWSDNRLNFHFEATRESEADRKVKILLMLLTLAARNDVQGSQECQETPEEIQERKDLIERIMSD